MVSRSVAEEFLAQDRVAFVGVSHDPKAFSAKVFDELRERGHRLLPVNPGYDEVHGERCYRTIADLPDGVDGAIVMVAAERSADVVRACAVRGIGRVWLFKGAGPSSVSPEAVALCHELGIEVIDGACPLMFAEPVGWLHQVHRAGRRLTGEVTA